MNDRYRVYPHSVWTSNRGASYTFYKPQNWTDEQFLYEKPNFYIHAETREQLTRKQVHGRIIDCDCVSFALSEL